MSSCKPSAIGCFKLKLSIKRISVCHKQAAQLKSPTIYHLETGMKGPKRENLRTVLIFHPNISSSCFEISLKRVSLNLLFLPHLLHNS